MLSFLVSPSFTDPKMLRLPSAPPVLVYSKLLIIQVGKQNLKKTLNQPTLFKNRFTTHLEKTVVMLRSERTQTYVGEHCLISPLSLGRSEACHSTPDYTDQEELKPETDCFCSTEGTSSLFPLQIHGQLLKKLSSKISFKISFP